MGFLDRLFSGKARLEKHSSAWACELTIKNKKYILTDFDWKIEEGVDRSNKPSGDVHGGLISFTFGDPVDQLIHNWIINAGTKHTGIVKFYTHSMDEGAQMEMKFEDAICARYFKQVMSEGEGVYTTLVISCARIKIGEEVFEPRQRL